MAAIFISYRREDSEGQAGRLFDELVAHFGGEFVFMDVVDVAPGFDFRRTIDQQVASCGVLLSVIGRHWVDITDKNGQQRLASPNDLVRLETASALKRNIPVVPVLVQGAKMPGEEQLPEDLRELVFRNAVELTHTRWDSDVQVLIKALETHLGGQVHCHQAMAFGHNERDDEARTRKSAAKVDLAGISKIEPPSPSHETKRKSAVSVLIVSIATIACLLGGYAVFNSTRESGDTKVGHSDEKRVDIEQEAIMGASKRRSATQETQPDKINQKSIAVTSRNLFVVDGWNSVGRIYKLNGGTLLEYYRRPSGGIHSLARSADGTLFFADANQPFVFRLDGNAEEIVYRHNTYVRAVRFDNRGQLYFSESSGANADGVIYRLEGGKAIPFYVVKRSDLGGFWAGTFAFDQSGSLWLSSGNRVPSELYEVVGLVPKRRYECRCSIMGFAFVGPSELLYADHRQSILRLMINTLDATPLASFGQFKLASDVVID